MILAPRSGARPEEGQVKDGGQMKDSIGESRRVRSRLPPVVLFVCAFMVFMTINTTGSPRLGRRQRAAS